MTKIPFPKVGHENVTFSKEMENAHQYNQWIIDYFIKHIGKTILEIGVGHGSFYTMIPKNRIQEYVGVDIDKELIKNASMNNPSASYVYGDLGSNLFVDTFSGKKFDTVLCFNVLEHIENDHLALNNMINILNDKGKLLLFVPAFNFLYTDIDKLAGHYRRYRITDIINLSKKSQGKITHWEYFNCIGGLGWLVNKYIKYSSLNDDKINNQIRIFNKFILPVSKFFQPVFKKIFGQSLCVVIEKESLK